jgi:hypothetical protein
MFVCLRIVTGQVTKLFFFKNLHREGKSACSQADMVRELLDTMREIQHSKVTETSSDKFKCKQCYSMHFS